MLCFFYFDLENIFAGQLEGELKPYHQDEYIGLDQDVF